MAGRPTEAYAARLAALAGHGGEARLGEQQGCLGEACAILSDLSQEDGGQDRTDAGEAAEELAVGMLGEEPGDALVVGLPRTGKLLQQVGVMASGEALAGDGTRRCSEQVGVQALGQHRGSDPASVAVTRQEARHAPLADLSRPGRCRVVAREGERHLAVEAREESCCGGVVAFQDGVELVLHAHMLGDDAFPVPGESAQLGEQRAGLGEWPPTRLLVTQRISEREGVEGVVFDGSHAVALTDAGGDPRADRVDLQAEGLEVLDEQAFGTLDRDRQVRAVGGQSLAELGEAGDVVGDLEARELTTTPVDDRHLMQAASPVDPRGDTLWHLLLPCLCLPGTQMLQACAPEPGRSSRCSTGTTPYRKCRGAPPAGGAGLHAGPRRSRCQGSLPPGEHPDDIMPSRARVGR